MIWRVFNGSMWWFAHAAFLLLWKRKVKKKKPNSSLEGYFKLKCCNHKQAYIQWMSKILFAIQNVKPWQLWCRVEKDRVFGGSGPSESSLGEIWCFRSTAPFVYRIGQKLSSAAPRTTPDFPVLVQDDSRVSHLSFYAFFKP